MADAQDEALEDPSAMWIQYPHARREMIKEMAFLGLPAVLAFAGWHAGSLISVPTPLFVNVFAGVLIGYLVGGGVVWMMRIVGSLMFGKEAMGLGDVHMMAAVGACLGWIDATLAFFVAAFVGIVWTVLGAVIGGGLRRSMPYGPYLAVATVLVVLCKPVIELGLGRLMGPLGNIDLP